ERPMSIALIASRSGGGEPTQNSDDAQPDGPASRSGGGEPTQNSDDAQPDGPASRRGGGEPTTWTAVARTIAGDRTDAELRWAATHDPLTGLPGRVLVYDRLEVALSRATRTGQRVGLLVLDLDFFDVVNTAVGADIADRLLAGVAERLARSIRPGDTIGRMGDDEFVVLCEHFDQLDDAERFAERLLRSVEEPIELDGADWFMSMSVGISVARPGVTNADSLLRSADTAMYRAKELGRGRHVVFGKGLQSPQLPFVANRQIG
ncbi:MAG: GGDEF domain-containing protein, partial [Actinobacteria bacterium]|nr:GGDEF domain-containing protein [Actinomycetota bacterium]